MQLKKLVFFLLTLTLMISVQAQECTAYFPMNEGAEFEMTQYNKKGKPTGSQKHSVVRKEENASSSQVEIKSIAYDKKGKETLQSTYIAKCEGDRFLIQMSSIVPAGMQEQYQMNTTAEIDGDFLELPSTMSVGQELPKGDTRISIGPLTMTFTVENRKVTAHEDVTTPAGTFDCYKIESEVLMNMGFKIRAKSADWYAKEVGVVRSESYSTNGNMTGYSELTSFKK